MRKVRLGTDIFGISLLLLVLVMVSCYMTTGLMARYTTGGAASDSARTARFEVDVENPLKTDIALQLNPVLSQTLCVSTGNSSEVSVRFYIEIVSSGNIPFTFTGDSTLTQLTPTSWYCDAAASTSGVNHYLTVRMSDNSYCYSGGVEKVLLTVEPIQID